MLVFPFSSLFVFLAQLYVLEFVIWHRAQDHPTTVEKKDKKTTLHLLHDKFIVQII